MVIIPTKLKRFAVIAMATLCAIPMAVKADLPSELQTTVSPDAPEAEWKDMFAFLVQKQVFPSDHAGLLVEYLKIAYPDEFSTLAGNEFEQIEAAKRRRSELFEEVSPHMAFSFQVKMDDYNFSKKSFRLNWDAKDFYLSASGRRPTIGSPDNTDYLPDYIPMKLRDGFAVHPYPKKSSDRLHGPTV